MSLTPKVGALDPAEEHLCVPLDARVGTRGVAMPDLDRSSPYRLARRDVHHAEPESERHSGLAVNDVATQRLSKVIARKMEWNLVFMVSSRLVLLPGKSPDIVPNWCDM